LAEFILINKRNLASFV